MYDLTLIKFVGRPLFLNRVIYTLESSLVLMINVSILAMIGGSAGNSRELRPRSIVVSKALDMAIITVLKRSTIAVLYNSASIVIVEPAGKEKGV